MAGFGVKMLLRHSISTYCSLCILLKFEDFFFGIYDTFPNEVVAKCCMISSSYANYWMTNSLNLANI